MANGATAGWRGVYRPRLVGVRNFLSAVARQFKLEMRFTNSNQLDYNIAQICAQRDNGARVRKGLPHG